MAGYSRRCSADSLWQHIPWTKLLVIAAIGGLIATAKRFGPTRQGVNWEERFKRMPDNAPPKWMFNQIRVIRQNTDRILELMEHHPSDETAPEGAAT